MKKGLFVMGILAFATAGLVLFHNMSDSSASGKFDIVTAPDQKEAMENEQFTTTEYVPREFEGENVARKGLMVSNGYTDVYPATNANDGSSDATCYWEGPAGEDAILTVNLKQKYNVDAIRLTLNPNPIWGKRVQTISISVSDDGENFTEIIPATDYEFNPDTHNEVILATDDGSLEAFNAQYVRLVISKNTGAKSGQIAEFEVYSKD